MRTADIIVGVDQGARVLQEGGAGGLTAGQSGSESGSAKWMGGNGHATRSPPTTAVSDDCTSALLRMILSPLETDPGQARSTKLAHRNMEPHLRRDGGS